jgi:hypothetical protein
VCGLFAAPSAAMPATASAAALLTLIVGDATDRPRRWRLRACNQQQERRQTAGTRHCRLGSELSRRCADDLLAGKLEKKLYRRFEQSRYRGLSFAKEACRSTVLRLNCSLPCKNRVCSSKPGLCSDGLCQRQFIHGY